MAVLHAEEVLTPDFKGPRDSNEVILVLGAGGSKGLAHIGVIEKLEELGIVPTKIVGCSVGAIIGALYAQNRDISKVKEILIGLLKNDIVDFSIFERAALSTRKKFVSFLEKHLSAKKFSDLEIELITVATDVQTGQAEYFTEGNLIDAVLASAAIPGLFAPYQIGDRKYIDGGLSAPLPIEHGVSFNGMVIASDIKTSLDDFDDSNFVNVMRKSFEIISQNFTAHNNHKADILLEICLDGITSPIEDGYNQEIYEKGRKVAQENESLIQTKYEEFLKSQFRVQSSI